MIRVTPTLSLPDSELDFEATVAASGPGGQHVNRTASAVRIRFNVFTSTALPDFVRRRLLELGGNNVTREGVLQFESNRFRSQLRNREDVLERLLDLIRQATVRPRWRIPTRPGRGAKERRLEGKRHVSRIKQDRRGDPG